MISVETARVLAVGGSALAGILGTGLTVSVLFAATVPVHEPIRTTLARIPGWALKALSVALRAFVAVVSLPYGVAVTYFHVGARVKRHRHVARGRHRPAYVKRNPWTPALGWSKGWATA